MIRVMNDSDILQVASLEQLCFTEPWSEHVVAEGLSNTLDCCFVAEEGGRVCGYCCFRAIDGEGEIQRIAVLPELWRAGYGKKLMDTMVQFARKNKVSEITLEVRSGNTAALNLYKSYGFKEEAVRRDYYRNPTEDAVIMWKRSV